VTGRGLPQPYAQWARAVFKASESSGVDPALLFAVMARETGGRNVVGDGGHGRGLMQIDDRSHGKWLAANEQGMNPETNVAYGARVLRANIDAFPGNLKAAVAAYNAGAGRVRAALAKGADPDTVTTGKNYAADVLARRERFAPMLEAEPMLHVTYDVLAGWRPSGVNALDVSEVRALVGGFYRAHEGLRSSGLTEEAYEALIFPNDRPEWRHLAADDMFSCALRFTAGLRLLRVKHPILASPYEKRKGRAVADARAVAESFGAVVDDGALTRYEPQAGDALCHGWGNNVHVSCVNLAHTDEEGRLILECSDGGQGRRFDMAIEANRYLWTPGRVQTVEGPTHSVERPGAPRPLVWVVDIAELLLNAGVMGQQE